MFPNPRTGASLILSFRLAIRGIFIIGLLVLCAYSHVRRSTTHAWAPLSSFFFRLATRGLGYRIGTVRCIPGIRGSRKGDLHSACEEIQRRIRERQLELHTDWNQIVDPLVLQDVQTLHLHLSRTHSYARTSIEELHTIVQNHRTGEHDRHSRSQLFIRCLSSILGPDDG